MNKKIGILGSGTAAKALATGFIKHGYDVMVGTSDASKLAEWKEGNKAGAVGSFEETARFGDAVVLAVKGMAAVSVVKSLSADLAGKTIMDATNPIAAAPPVNGVLQYFTSANESLLELLQQAVPEAHFVKAFNSVGNAYMVDPVFPNGKPTMFIAGNHEEAKKEVSAILDGFGWEVADMGKAESGRPIEALCILWCLPGFLHNEWTHAFKLMKA